jgi:hypothetical protein
MAQLDPHPVPSLGWMKCKRLSKETACLRVRISPARERERVVRCCDVCPVGSRRAKGEAAHARRVAAREMSFGASA